MRSFRAFYPEIAGSIAGVALFSAAVTGFLPASLRIVNPDRAGWLVAVALLLAGAAAYAAVRSRQDSASAGINRTLRIARFVTRAIVPVFAFVLAASPLANAWSEGRGGYFALGGLLPWSDASNYYAGAVEISELGRLDFWNERRPINAGINSAKFRLGGRLKGWLVTSAFLAAIGLVLVAREVTMRFGPAAAAGLMGGICAHGSATYWFTTMSENNGLLIGLFAAAILLAAIRLRDRRWFWAGAFVLAVALDARAGAMFTLPLLWIWGGITYGDTFARRVRIGLVAMLLTVLAVLPGRAYAALWTEGRGAAHGNLSYTLYGMAVGNKGWRQVFRDYPEIKGLADEKARTNFIYERSFERIRANPGRFLTAVVQGMRVFVGNLQGFVSQRALLTLLVALLCIVRWRDPLSTLILCVLLGSVLSAPFLIWDGGGRVFAATIPLIALVQAIAIGVAEVPLVAAIGRMRPGQEEESATVRQFVPVAAMALTAALLLAPFASLVRRASALPAVPRLVGASMIAFVPGRSGEWLNVFPDLQPGRVWAPNVRETGVLRDLWLTDIHGIASPAPFSIGMAVDDQWNTITADPTWFVTPTGMHLPRTKQPVLLVGEMGRTQRRYPYLRVSAIYVLAADRRAWRRFESPR